MSDLIWVREHAPAYLAGGLSPDDATKFDQLVRDNPDCAAALDGVRRLDDALSALFADARPGPELENKLIDAGRTVRRRRLAFAGWQRRAAVGLAASVGLGVVGFGVAEMGRLPFPGAAKEVAVIALDGDDDSGVGFKAKVNNEYAEGLRRGTRELATASFKSSNRSPAANYYYEQPVADRGDEVKAGVALDLAKPFDGEAAQGEEGRPRTRLSTRGLGVPGSGAGVSAGEGVQPGKDGQPTGPALNFGFVPSNNKPTDRYFVAPMTEDSLGKALKSVTAAEVESKGKPAETELRLKQHYRFDDKKDGKFLPDTASDFSKAPQPNPTAGQEPKPQAPAPAAARKIIIRSGDIEFEIESFDSAVAGITKLVVAIPGGFVGTVNSEKLANGKVKGSVVVRVPPDALDTLVLDLRRDLGKGGELKGQRIGSQDITKQYTDLESRLKAARTMETRLLKIIQDGKGEIKQLLEAEKELGVWRTKIEEYEGELRYFANLASLSTLTITLSEKEIRAAAVVTEAEKVSAGVEAEDVDKVYQQLLTAVTDAKGRVSKAEVKQLTAGQFNATVAFEVPPDASGPMRDRLRQLGRVARLEIDRTTSATDGTTPRTAPVKKGDATFLVQIYNVANITPRETVITRVAATDVPAAYQSIRDAVAKAGGRLLNAKLDESDKRSVSATVDFEVKRIEEPAVREVVTRAGELLGRAVNRAAESDAVTDTKVRYSVTVANAARLAPRETTTLGVEVADVDAAVAVLTAQAVEAKGRVADANTSRDRAGQVTARLTFEVPLAAASGLAEKVKNAGTVRVLQTARDPQAADGPLATARLDVTLSNADLIVPADDGLWSQVRKGLSVSATTLLKSVTWAIVGLCVVLPWAVILWAGYRLMRRANRGPAAAG